MDAELRALTDRLTRESAASREPGAEELCARLATTEDHDELAALLIAPAQPLWARELAACRLGVAGDSRAFESLVLLLNHRDPQRCASAARALARLGDPRTARAAAALATNELRVAYALHPVRLLTTLRAPESVPALITTLERRLAQNDPYREVALACVAGLGVLGDRRAVPVLKAAEGHSGLRAAAAAALARIPQPHRAGPRRRSPGRPPATG
ncbi:adenylosuccinate lyase [Streptomyces tsukubensis]|uniref:Adenylosuccinate lyase n=1 Tax=Streptomyces tsukubensis TaxID=83656 RepID=A0A1V4AE29_9ACTN|nr:adenylosuccinate lyase [Streptomyces tsukubensis]OON81743.1 adenylosuccinate lyase [Streptomyces tsukubensis]QFR96518.1 adenylosuccinate lyase [Streptomyces tsukubensis]